jgi:protein involved in temperature-dependent protein secretion
LDGAVGGGGDSWINGSVLQNVSMQNFKQPTSLTFFQAKFLLKNAKIAYIAIIWAEEKV